jgi:hypothetical protein
VNQEFKDNIMNLFGVDTPHLDTVFKLLTEIPNEAFVELKEQIIQILFEKKFFNKAKKLGLIYIAIDGTGLYSFDKQHCQHCLTKTSKRGVVTYYHNVLEAKIVFDGNLCFSIATEFIENESPNVTKQDCEINAGKRLMDKLKKKYPKLKICILGDALYASSTIINKCIQFGWKYIITFKEDDLKQLEANFKASKSKQKCITRIPPNIYFNRTYA